MPRTATELKQLLENVKEWYFAEFGIEYNLKYLKPLVEELISERAKKFVFKRLGHLPTNDLIALVSIMENDARQDAKAKGQ